MTQQKNIRGALAMATCSLLGATAAHAADGDWKVDSAVLLYSEQDRVSAVEPVVSATKDMGDEQTLNLKLVLDSLTGPSANGAQVEAYPQTFTTPSGNQNYTVPAGEVPLDEEFHDTRGALSATWTKPLENRLWKRTLGANVSSEYDFFSLGVNGALSRDFNKRNTTVTAGLGYEMDTIKPVGGTPVPFAEMFPVAGSKAAGDTEDRTVTDLLLGVTQVVGRNTIMQFNYNLSMSSGYMNDPYKVVTVVDPLDPPGTFTYMYENRPDSRTKHALYWETKHAFASGNVLDASYRLMTDDWGIMSNTLDARYLVKLANDWYVEPHVRWYDQGEADFYVDRLAAADQPAANDTTKEFSADYRLGALTTTTFGARVGKKLADDGDAYVRLESMTQSGDTEQADLSAVIVEVGYSFKW